MKSRFGYYAVLISLAMGIFYTKSIQDSKDGSDHDCVFCQIVKDDKKGIYQDDDVYIFPDRTPKASTHLMVIPKRHIKSVKTLIVEDLPLVVKMKQAAEEYVNKEHYGKTYRLGFHIPPFYSIPHLHMHILVEPFTPPRKRMSYTPHFGGLWYRDADTVINDLADTVV